MFIDLTPEQRQLQAEIRQYFSNLISPDERTEMEKDRHGPAYRAVIRRMGRDGRLGVGWPKEFGGLGFGPIEQQIFVNEAHRAAAADSRAHGKALCHSGIPACEPGENLVTVSPVVLPQYPG